MQLKKPARKLDYSSRPVRTTDHECADTWPSGSASALTDGLGSGSYPAAWRVWTRTDAPNPGKPASVVIDYGEPVAVSALVHYFYVPGSRDHRWKDYLCGSAAFREVRIHVSDDGASWTEAAHLSDLPTRCPQMLRIPAPKPARYLKLEVVSLAPGAPGIRSYELETYVDGQPDEPLPSETGKAVRRGFPNAAALEPAAALPVRLSERGALIRADRCNAKLRVRLDDREIHWKQTQERPPQLIGKSASGTLLMDLRAVLGGLLVEIAWDGPSDPPFHKLDVLAGPDAAVTEWCIPGYHFSRTRPDPVSIASAIVPTCMAAVSDGEHALTVIPDTDRSWVGLEEDCAVATFPLDRESVRVLVLLSDGGWQSGLRKAVREVFGFEEPRQFSPVSKAIPELCRFVLRPELWSEKYQMLRSFPDTDFFYIFYSLPYAVPALTMWETMSGDESVRGKIDCILRFTLDRRLKDGPMAGALFSEYADRELVEQGKVPFGHAPFYEWHKDYPEEQLVGLDQGCSRWITAHNMGAVLWAITYVWQSRGALPEDVLAGARDVADWMARLQNDDGSWHYAYREDGSVASPMSDSGTIWNVWSLWRFGRLTGDRKYLDAAEKARAYFTTTFTANHMYRGYWEDIYGGGKTELNTAQGYESAIAAMAFTEMGDTEAAISSAQDAVRFICTRTLESRDYWTSYGGVAEQQNWAPGTYIAPTFGYAAHLAWRMSGDDFFRPFASIAKTIGWWQDRNGGAFWLSAAVTQQPIEMLREEGGDRQFWALWDSAQKVAFSVPWLVDEVNRRTGDRMKLSTASLRGTDDRGKDVFVSVFDGQVQSESGQVNWVGLRCPSGGEYQLVLMNHAEATRCTIRTPFDAMSTTVRAFDAHGVPRQAAFTARAGQVSLTLPERCTAVVAWESTT